MYSCYDGYLVYGFTENSRELMLDREWLEENYPDIVIFAMDIVRGYCGDVLYGVVCELNKTTGHAVINPTSMKMVDELYVKVAEYNKNDKDYKHGKLELGYFVGILGDFSIEHTEYCIENESD